MSSTLLNVKKKSWSQIWNEQKFFILLSIPFIVYIIVIYYVPLWGWLMAFQNYRPHKGISGSEWVGLKNFVTLFNEPMFYQAIRNTFAMSGLRLFFGFTGAITVAVFINELRLMWFRNTVQTISYLPHFISWAVAGNLVLTMLQSNGPVNDLLLNIGLIQEPIIFMGEKNLFWIIVALSDLWKEVGWNAIIYLSAMTAISPDLYEAAQLDGASRLQRIFHITIPNIMPVVTIILVMEIGKMLNTGFEQQMVMMNSLNRDVAEVLDLYVIRYGLQLGRISYATAAGIFKTVVSVTMVYFANKVSTRSGGEKLI